MGYSSLILIRRNNKIPQRCAIDTGCWRVLAEGDISCSFYKTKYCRTSATFRKARIPAGNLLPASPALPSSVTEASFTVLSEKQARYSLPGVLFGQG
jgi:hypothetical protein